MTAWFGRYAAAFDAFDPDAMAEFFVVPCAMVDDRGVMHLGSREAIRDHMAAICETHREAGYGRARVAGLRTRDVSQRVRFAEVDWEIEDASGAPLWSFTNSYQLARFGGDWKILTSAPHGAPGEA